MLALIYVGIFAVIGFFAQLDITQTALFSFPTFAKMLDAPPPHSGVLSNSSVITATPDDDAVTIVWSEWVIPTPTPTPTPAFQLVCPLNGATHGIIPGVTTCEVRSTCATMAGEGVSWPGDIPSLELGTPSFPVASVVLLTSLLLGAGLLVVYRCLLLVLGISLAEMHAPQQEQTARPAAEASPDTHLLTRYGPVDAAGDLTTRKLARPPTSAKTEGSVWVSRLRAERTASVAGEEQQQEKKKKQPLRACWKGERAKQEKPALRSAVHWEGVEERGTPAGGPLQVPRTVDAAESAAGVASGADGGKRADTKAPGHAGGDGRATPRSTVSPAVEVKSGKAAGSTTAPGGGGGVEKAKRGVVIRGTRGGRSARGGSGVSAESRRWRVGKKCQRNQLERQCELVATWKRHELLCGRLAARRQRHAATSAPPPPPPATPHSASAPAAPAQARIGGPMSWEPTDDAVDALAVDLAGINILAPGEQKAEPTVDAIRLLGTFNPGDAVMGGCGPELTQAAPPIDMEDLTWHSTVPTHPGDIIMAETLPNPAPASGLAAPPTGDVCMADVAQTTAPNVQMADDAVLAEGVAITLQAVQAAQAAQAVRVQDVQAYVAAQVPTIHQAPMPAQQQPRANRLAGAARKLLGGSPLRSMSNARPTPAKVSADVTPGPTEHEMYCPRENCGQITWKSMATCKVCKEKKTGAETATYAIPGDYQPYGNE
ncbi:hypothetical protein LTR74_016243 [Friedmanniomyces endolithicus]|nr:hypothetical protein LTR74_016243 [Friedmanniomyces endolithicus]